MANMQESSVLFSLNQLMNIEQERLREEEEAERRHREGIERARLDSERLALAEQEAQIQAETARRRAEEAAKREEAPRLEAIQLAAIERARAEAENRARANAMTQQHAHEQRLAVIAGAGRKSGLTRGAGLGVALSILLACGGLGVYFGKIKPEADLAYAQKDAELATQQDEMRRMQAALASETKRVEASQIALAKAKSDAERAAAERELAEAQAAQTEAQDAVTTRRAWTPKTTKATQKATACTCDPKDPLCGCFK